jgi:membrane fusion protein, copper/silver efflux system
MMDRMRELNRRVWGALRERWQRLPVRLQRVTPFAVVLLLGLFIGSTLFGRAAPPSDDGVDGVRSANGHDLEQDGVEWTCSMHPQIRQPGPGKCPICGMDLIPVAGTDEDADHGELPRLVVSERAAALMGVQVWPAERRGLSGEVRLSGVVDYDETQLNDVVVRTEGQVERLHVNYENASVQRGQRVADIYSPAILAASQELLQAHRAAQRGGMADLVEAAAAQLLALGVSRAQVDRILESGEPARTYSLYSPSSGVVTSLDGRQGEWLTGGARLMRVASIARVWAQFEAYERDLAGLRVGAPVRFTVESFPGEFFSGTIAFIDPVVDGGRRTARVRVQVENPGGRLKPGMLARGQATGAEAAGSSVVIPATAPLLTGRRALVYVQIPGRDRPTFEPREVTLGTRSGAHWEVASGLGEGELVVVNGAFKIDSELQIRGRGGMMAGPAPTRDHEGLTSPRGGMPGVGTDRGSVPIHLSAAAGARVEAVVDAYLDVTEALARDDGAAARTAAVALRSALVAAELPGLGESAGRAWNHLRTQLSGHATAMANTADLDALRRELVPLSELVERSAAMFHADVGPLFRAVCPMVDGAEGSWLSRAEEVRNPYYGEEMLECGEVEGRVAG